MRSNRKIYWILSLLSLAGYCWAGLEASGLHGHEGMTVCLFKKVTGIPCPSCGTTRSLLLLLQGDLQQAVMTNPMGFIAAALLVIIPLWIVADLATGKAGLLNAWNAAEKKIKTHKTIYLPLATLAIANWIWNIAKGL